MQAYALIPIAQNMQTVTGQNYMFNPNVSPTVPIAPAPPKISSSPVIPAVKKTASSALGKLDLYWLEKKLQGGRSWDS